MTTQARTQHLIRGLAPAAGYRAVYAYEENGGVTVDPVPFDFFGAADVRVRRDGEWVDDRSEIVGLKLGDGFFDILDDDANFYGIVRDGATWEECVELLPSELQVLVVNTQEGCAHAASRCNHG